MKNEIQHQGFTIKIRTRLGYKFVNTEEILYIKAENKESVIYLKNKGEILTTHLLKWYCERLSSKLFFRCHNSYIINISKVAVYTRKEITLITGSVIPFGIGKLVQFENVCLKGNSLTNY